MVARPDNADLDVSLLLKSVADLALNLRELLDVFNPLSEVGLFPLSDFDGFTSLSYLSR